MTDLPPEALVFLPDLLLRRVGRPLDADVPEIVETDLDGAVALAERSEELHLQPGNSGQIRQVDVPACQVDQALVSLRQRARQELAFGPVQLEREGECAASFPAVLRQQRAAGSKIGRRRLVGRRL